MSVTASQFQLFKSIANPARVDMAIPKPQSPPISPKRQRSPSPTFISNRPIKRVSTSSGRSNPSPSLPRVFTAQTSPPVTPPPSPKYSPPHPYTPRRRSSPDVSISNFAEKEAEKAVYIMEMQRIQAAHPHIRSTRRFTTADSFEDVELEYNRQKIASDTMESVDFLSNCLKMGLSGAEMINARFGPWLALDGFAEETCSDMKKFRPALARIYKRVWRRGCMNPWIELLMLIGGGVFMFHFKSKILGHVRPKAHASVPAMSPAFNLGAFTAPPPPPSNHGTDRMRRPTRPPMPPPSEGLPSMGEMASIIRQPVVVRQVTLKPDRRVRKGPSITVLREPLEIDD